MPRPPAPLHPPRFAAHGRVELESEAIGQATVLHFDSTGPFNRELVDRVREAYTPIFAEAAAQGPFAHISSFHGSMLATPEAFAAFAALIAEWRAAGIAPAANAYVVTPEVEGRNLMLAYYRHAWSDLPFEVFERQEDAEAWIAKTMSGPR